VNYWLVAKYDGQLASNYDLPASPLNNDKFQRLVLVPRPEINETVPDDMFNCLVEQPQLTPAQR